ncbi:MAG: hypothetical protein M3N47_11070 [Chloroflexota bacterium]|nr:hypothetical protein [Chloroflexota bacterium]
MPSIGSIHFNDGACGDPAWIGVRVDEAGIGLAASLRNDGDVEVFLGRSEGEALRDALVKAIQELS